MDLRLALVAPLLGALACNHGDDPGSGSTSTFGDGNPATMTLTTMSAGGTMGDDSGTGTSTGTGGGQIDESGTTSTGPVECPGTCVEAVPDGWSGPVATLDSDPLGETPDCPRGFPTVATQGFDDLDAPAAICTCDCGTPQGVLCEQTAVLVDYGAAVDCDGPPVHNYTLADGSCAATTIAASSWVALQQVDMASAGSCSPIPSTTLPATGWQTRVTACEGTVARGYTCDDPGMGCLEVAPADPLGTGVCIWQDGENDCPADSAYAVQRILYNGLDDTRDCGECTCDDPVGVCDDSAAEVFNATSCTFPISGTAGGNGFCHQIGAAGQHAVYNAGTPTSFCAASDVEATGDVSGTMPITLCCTR